MVQFRVTRKFTSDYKLGKLEVPEQNTSRFDDWVIDVFRIDRKKVAIITHVKTLLTFLVPYSQVGGAKKIPEQLRLLLQQFLDDHGFSKYIEEMHRVFEEPFQFFKTKNPHVLGHMNDFKQCLKVQAHYVFGESFEAIDWNKMGDYINNMPMNFKTMGFIFPVDLMKNLLEQV